MLLPILGSIGAGGRSVVHLWREIQLMFQADNVPSDHQPSEILIPFLSLWISNNQPLFVFHIPIVCGQGGELKTILNLRLLKCTTKNKINRIL